MNTALKGIILGIVSEICYGMNPLGAEFLYAENIRTSSVLFYRFALAVLILAAVMGVRKIPFRIAWRELAFAGMLGVFMAISSFTFYRSFLYMDCGIASTLLFLYPVMVAVIMVLFFHEKPSWSIAGAIVLSLAGVAVLSITGAGALALPVTGIVLISLSALSYALYLVAVDRIPAKAGALQLTFYVLIFCTLCQIVFSLFEAEPGIQLLRTWSAWGWALMLAVVPGILALVLMIPATRMAGATPMAITGAVEPVTAVLVSCLFLGEAFTQRLIIGIVLILAAVLLVILGKKAPQNA